MVPHVVAQRVAVPVAKQDVAAQAREALSQRRVAGDRAGSHQRLVLPGPRLVPQVCAETVEGVDEHSLRAVRAQPRIHLVERALGRHGRQNVDEPLGEAGVEGGEIDGLRSGGHGAGVVVVHEDEVEVGAVAELDAAELAIGDDRVGCERSVFRHRSRPSVAGGDVAPCEGQRRAQHRFRDLREVVADHHQGDPARYVRRGHPQDVGLLRLAQAVHLELAIRIVDGGQARGDVPVEIVGPERLVEGARIEQLVEQHRMLAEQPRDPGARRAELHELRQRDGALGQEREVGAALRDRFDHRHHPLERRRRVALRHDRAQQIGQEAGQPLPPERIGHLEIDGVPVTCEDRPRFAGGVESRLFECGHRGRFVGGGGEQDVERIASGAGIGLALRAEHLRELLVHVAPMMVEPLAERFPARIAHARRDSGTARLVRRKHVLLPIADLLYAMLGGAQKPVRGAQRPDRMGGEQIEIPQAREHRQQAPVAERGVRPPRTIWNACAVNSTSRIPPGPCFTLCSMPLRATSCSITTFSERSDWRVPKSM